MMERAGLIEGDFDACPPPLPAPRPPPVRRAQGSIILLIFVFASLMGNAAVSDYWRLLQVRLLLLLFHPASPLLPPPAAASFQRTSFSCCSKDGHPAVPAARHRRPHRAGRLEQVRAPLRLSSRLFSLYPSWLDGPLSFLV